MDTRNIICGNKGVPLESTESNSFLELWQFVIIKSKNSTWVYIVPVEVGNNNTYKIKTTPGTKYLHIEDGNINKLRNETTIDWNWIDEHKDKIVEETVED
jgi:hypothetical protein